MIDSGAIVVPYVVCCEFIAKHGAANDAEGHYVRQNVHDDAWARQAVNVVIAIGSCC